MKRLYLVVLAIFAITFAMAKDSYLPTCVDGREYIYVMSQYNDTIRQNSPNEIEITEHNYWIGMSDWEYLDVHGYYDEQRDSLVSTIFKKIDDECVYFDYSMNVSDTLNIFHFETTTTGVDDAQFYLLYGTHIKVLSIDTVILGEIERLCYNLECKDITYWLRFGMTDGCYWQTLKQVEEGIPYGQKWIEGIGYTNYVFMFSGFNSAYKLHCVFENGENIYTAEGAECDGLSDNINEKIDFSTLTLQRSGDVLMATFPTAGQGEAITLYDATGRVVATQPIREGATTTSIDVATLPDGIYIVRLSNGATAKVVL